MLDKHKKRKLILNNNISFQKSDSMSSSETCSQSDSSSSHIGTKFDITAATFLDVAVLRCLFILHWQEEGVYWCLHYIYNRYVNFFYTIDKFGSLNKSLNSFWNRLRKISEEIAVTLSQTRRRSNSLPIPQIEISVYQGTNSNSRDSPSGNTLKDFIEVPDQAMPILLTGKKLFYYIL